MRLPRPKSSGIVLIEVLIILLVLMLLVVLMLPYLAGGGPAKGAQCRSNQQQITVGFILWDSDNAGKFPWQVSETNQGAMEASARGDVVAGYKTLQGYLQWPPVFVCPTDPSRTAATNFLSLGNQNLSYFINFDGVARATNAFAGIMTGDRHLSADGTPVKPGLFTYSTNMVMGWTTELHSLAATPM